MATADILILITAILSVALGVWRGLVKEVLSLVVWVVAFWASLTFGRPLAGLMSGLIDSPSVRGALGFTLLFIAVIVAGALITKLVHKAVAGSGLELVNRLTGGAFGLLRGFAIVVVLLTVVSYFPVRDAAWLKASSLVPQFAPYVAWVRGHLGSASPLPTT